MVKCTHHPIVSLQQLGWALTLHLVNICCAFHVWEYLNSNMFKVLRHITFFCLCSNINATSIDND